jgi:hypothetical protein
VLGLSVQNYQMQAYDGIFSAGSGGVNRDVLFFESNDRLSYNGYTSSAYDWIYTSSQRFRDPAAWYHIVVVQDTGQETASNRIKIYVNGEQITDWYESSDPNRYKTGYVSNTNEHTIGSTPYDTTYFDGYITEVNFVDGTALTPASFGETKAGTWIPKAYTGSYGSLGYYLKFGNSSSLGTDSSGNGNTWTVTNIVATDQVPDSPTNNFAILNTLSPGAWAGYNSYSEGGLQYATPVTGGGFGQGTIAIPSSDNWYFEVYVKTAGFSPVVGFCRSDCRNAFPSDADPSITYYSYGTAGYLLVNGSTDSGADAGKGAEDDDIVGVSYDGTDVKFYKNNSLMYTKTYDVSGLVPLVCDGTSGSTGTTGVINFGQDSSFAGNKTAQGNTDANGRGDFYYSPPSGHLALCTANLPDPPAAFNPALDASPQDHFNTVLYTGNGSSISVTGVGFQPDWVWLKRRDANSTDHETYDAVRGATKYLLPNTRNAENTLSSTLTSFDSDGYSYGNSSNTNDSGKTYVAWNWKAGGSGVSNSDGTISSTVSANTDAGFSIATYTGNGSASATVGHGLGATPAMVIVKCRSDGADEGEWTTAHQGISGQVVFLNQTLQSYNPAVFSTGGVALGNSSAFSFVNGTASVDNSNKSGNTYVAYCFAEVEGFSKFGSYTGNGSRSGPFINTGFRPAFVIMKRTDSAHYWFMHDSKRDPYNVAENYLFANDPDDEASYDNLDILSNGFKLRLATYNPNVSGGTYIYMAFAEMPFKYANAR